MARSSRSSALSRVDLPLLGAPRMATGTPSAMARPVEKPSSSWAMRSSKIGHVAPVTVAVGKLHVLFGEIELQLHQGGVLDEGLAKGVDLFAEPSAQLLQGESVGTGVIGFDEVADGFRLGQVAFAVQEGALGEFAGQSGPASGIDQALHEALGDERAAVNVALDHIFAGKTARPSKGQEQGFVQGPVSIVKVPQEGAAGHRSFEPALAESVYHGPSTGTAHADHGHASASRRGGDRANGAAVKRVCRHGGKLAPTPFRSSLYPRYFCAGAPAPIAITPYATTTP